MPDKPLHFDECFDRTVRTGEGFRRYVSILEKSSPGRTPEKPERHHIVPREWLSWRCGDFNYATEDGNNVVYLSVRHKILAMLCLARIFLDARDGETYKRLTRTIARRYRLGWYDFWKSPHLDPGMISFLAEKRRQELKNRKTKYSGEYLARCREMYEADPEGAFDSIKRDLGFRHTERALLEQLKRRFPQSPGPETVPESNPGKKGRRVGRP